MCNIAQLTHFQMSDGVALVDTRSKSEFDGFIYDYQPQKGSIPTAIHFSFTDLFDDRGRFVDRRTYMQRLPIVVRLCGSLVNTLAERS